VCVLCVCVCAIRKISSFVVMMIIITTRKSVTHLVAYAQRPKDHLKSFVVLVSVTSAMCVCEGD
jgi:hypothetical protein